MTINRRYAKTGLLVLSTFMLMGQVARSQAPWSFMSPPLGSVPLKIWVILGDADTLFDPQNVGCRFGNLDFQLIIWRLQENSATLFGTNNRFTWSGSITNVVRVRTALLPGTPGQVREPQEVDPIMEDVLVNQGKWAGNMLNIYFCGYLQDNGGDFWGFDDDPRDDPNHPKIVINDGGDDNVTGNDALVIIFQGHILEHEMAHHLLRRDTSNPPDPDYDANEHVSASANSIMADRFAVPLVLPSAEQQEAKGRLETNGWKLP